MTQPGETDGYNVSDHLKALLRHSGVEHLVDAVLVNDNLPDLPYEKYSEKGQFPVGLDIAEIKKLGIDICAKNLVEPSKDGLIRHSAKKVARAAYYWFRKEQKNG
jgi:2-phospho-L-lactate transferase/gluconeogenesis factor (CofD/UPF0052 family)